MSNKLKTDSLFVERCNNSTSKEDPIYTLLEQPTTYKGKEIPSCYQEFMKCVDEYDAAIKLFGSKKQWDKLKTCKWFWEGNWRGCPSHRGAKAWLEEMKLRDISLAKSAIMNQAKKGSAQAAKTLLDIIKQEDGTPSRGRPRREDVQKEAAKQAEEERGIQEDLERLNVVKIRDNNG